MNTIKTSFSTTVLWFAFIWVLCGCTPETETETLTTPGLQMHAEGPFFEGPNTVTVSWEFDLQDYTNGKIQVNNLHKASIEEISITLKSGNEIPVIERVVIETTSTNTSMNRVGMLERQIKADEPYTLKIADIQKEVADALKDQKITFVADFDLADEEFFDDIHFELRVKFDVEVKK